ncbi:MAG: hypothetical protein Edafosvirus7_41 [Edafosvirus sp.]|uniref:Uncharacterized protein n=1 Tax=Edafosvirus sp. TaxID=2487765 RepID=A0A3G4ZXY2_9VIRU|nr:MAG: hypothetical protein Edafosvirus7_41 [Edafosvirus sp.]
MADKVYYKYKYIFSGLKTFEDAYLFYNKLINIPDKKLPKEHKDIIYSYILGKKYDTVFDFKKMIEILKELDECKYREDTKEIVDNFLKKITDITQIKTIMKIVHSKPMMPHITQKQMKEKVQELITKKCPHCGHKCSLSKDNDYVVCGYLDNGYDWKGCTKDWCFKCGKMLCKSWENDQLFLSINRVHDEKCCKKHANGSGKKYPDDYCQCVQRVFPC